MLEQTRKIELIWCIDDKIICAPDNKVKIPKTSCKNNKSPIILIDIKKSDNLFL